MYILMMHPLSHLRVIGSLLMELLLLFEVIKYKMAASGQAGYLIFLTM